MTPWQRRLRAAIAVFGVGFAILLYFAIRQPQAPAQRSQTVAREDPRAAMESTGCEILQLRGDREDFRIECERSLVYEDGRQRILGARIFVGQREGRDVKITGREAEIGDKEQQVTLRGNIELTTSDGMVVQAPEASYHTTEGIVRAFGAVAFTTARLSGTSVGMTYEEARGLLWLLDRAVLTLAPSDPGQPAVDITAGAAGFARPDHYVRFERGFRLVQGDRVLESDQATAYLSDDESRVVMLEMRGHSRVTGMGDAAGSLRAMAAQDINIEFAEDGRTLEAATLSRDGSVDVAGSGPESRRVVGMWIDARMLPDGATISSLSAREGVRLELPKDGAEPARTVSAAALVSRGEPGKGLTSAVFTDGVEFREMRPPSGAAAITRVARSRRLDLAVQPGFGRLRPVLRGGAVRGGYGARRRGGSAVSRAGRRPRTGGP